ncbi:putative ammonium transporter 2 [Glandiceps talaboti]
MANDDDEHFISRDDASWILTCAFIIFSMQSGFGLLESGSVSSKNEANIMVKNAIDVIFGGLSYWAFGYGLSFGVDKYSNPFCGVGDFFVDASDKHIGSLFSNYFFQASFATTATTIVSGAMAERTKLEAYIVFSFLNTFIYCIPCHWIWGKNGWLNQLRVIDIAGSGAVHLVGGTTGLIATLMLGPRYRRFEKDQDYSMGNPTNVLLGMFMLWWGWLGFNCGSSYGITGNKWILASRSAVTTINASVGGGSIAILLSYVMKKRKFDIGYLVNGVLGALVAVTAICAFASPWSGWVIGVIGAIISCLGTEMIETLKIDDPVGVVPVHFMSAIWGMLAVGLFIKRDHHGQSSEINGLLYGGGVYILGIQTLAVVAIIAWTSTSSFIVFKLIDWTIGLRLPLTDELLGADIAEHGLRPKTSDKRVPLAGYSRNETNKMCTSVRAQRNFSNRVSFKSKKKRSLQTRGDTPQSIFSIHRKNSKMYCDECRQSSTLSEVRDTTCSAIVKQENADSNTYFDTIADTSFLDLSNDGFIGDEGVNLSCVERTLPHRENCLQLNNKDDCCVDGVDRYTLPVNEVIVHQETIPPEIIKDNCLVNKIINYHKDGNEITLII